VDPKGDLNGRDFEPWQNAGGPDPVGFSPGPRTCQVAESSPVPDDAARAKEGRGGRVKMTAVAPDPSRALKGKAKGIGCMLTTFTEVVTRRRFMHLRHQYKGGCREESTGRGRWPPPSLHGVFVKGVACRPIQGEIPAVKRAEIDLGTDLSAYKTEKGKRCRNRRASRSGTEEGYSLRAGGSASFDRKRLSR